MAAILPFFSQILCVHQNIDFITLIMCPFPSSNITNQNLSSRFVDIWILFGIVFIV